MAITALEIELALSNVLEPTTQKDIISLGMVEHIAIDGNKVLVEIKPNSPTNFGKTKLEEDCKQAILKNVSPDLEVEIHFLQKVAENTHRLETCRNIKRVIGVASGKGGVGKSTIAANLAVALGLQNKKVALFDADIYGPSVPTLFNIHSSVVEAYTKNDKSYLIPVEKYGIKLMSIGFIVEDNDALVWRGPMASNALRQLLDQTDWGALDYLIIDLPPGTGDIQLTISQLFDLSGIIMVSTPQQMAIADVKRAYQMFMNEQPPIPVLGFVENMAYFVNSQTAEKQYIFGKEGAKQLAELLNVPLLAQIPLINNVVEESDKGTPFAYNKGNVLYDEFQQLAEKIRTLIEE